MINAVDRKTIEERIRSALLQEVYVTPKPGLVDLKDCGAHKDMDVSTFQRSADAITPYLFKMYEAGFLYAVDGGGAGAGESGSGGSFEQLFLGAREIGKEAEKAMMSATGNVNTHRGMIFSMGLLLTAMGVEDGRKYGRKGGTIDAEGQAADKYASLPYEDRICFLARDIAGAVLEKELEAMGGDPSAGGGAASSEASDGGGAASGEVSDGGGAASGEASDGGGAASGENERICEAPTHGERVFAAYGIDGVRGEAMAGFPCLREVALPRYRKMNSKGLKENDKALDTLLAVMSKLSDTNLISRGGLEGLAFVQDRASEILSSFAAGSDPWLQEITRFNQECIERNISPGGAADMLALALLLTGWED